MNNKILEQIKEYCRQLSDLTNDINFGFENRKYWVDFCPSGVCWSVSVVKRHDVRNVPVGKYEHDYYMSVYESNSNKLVLGGLIEAIEKLKSFKTELMQTSLAEEEAVS